jgi:hypothetical protein
MTAGSAPTARYRPGRRAWSRPLPCRPPNKPPVSETRATRGNSGDSGWPRPGTAPAKPARNAGALLRGARRAPCRSVAYIRARPGGRIPQTRSGVHPDCRAPTRGRFDSAELVGAGQPPVGGVLSPPPVTDPPDPRRESPRPGRSTIETGLLDDAQVGPVGETPSRRTGRWPRPTRRRRPGRIGPKLATSQARGGASGRPWIHGHPAGSLSSAL